MAMQAMVSINIPTYRQADLLPRAVASALAQTYANVEVNVLDDASPDDTAAVANSLASKNENLHVYVHAQNKGRVGTYQDLISIHCHGEWAVNLDGDDYFSNHAFIETALHSIEKAGQGVAFFQGNHVNLTAVKQLPSARELDAQTILVDGLEYMQHYHQIESFDHFATVYPVAIARQIGFYTFDSLNTDFHSVMRLCKHGAVIVSSIPVGQWNFNAASESNKIFLNPHFQQYMAAVDDLADYFNDTLSSQAAAALKKNLRQTILKYLFYQALQSGNTRAAYMIAQQHSVLSIQFWFYLLKLLKKRFVK